MRNELGSSTTATYKTFGEVALTGPRIAISSTLGINFNFTYVVK